MKTNILLTAIIAIIFSGCSSPKYLPTSDKIDINQYGSYINIKYNTTANIDGELISIDSNNIAVLTVLENKCITVPIKDIGGFTLRYAKPKHYGWTIPLFTLATIGQGAFALISAPINLIVTVSVTASGEKDFQYSDKNMTYEKLRMFARFPQGIPANLEITNIK